MDMGVLSGALEACMVAKPRPANVEDIDKDDHGNPQLCADYAQDVYLYMHKLEVHVLQFKRLAK